MKSKEKNAVPPFFEIIDLFNGILIFLLQRLISKFALVLGHSFE